MDGLSSLMTWFIDNEAALSGVAATVVILGFVASPLGAGLRGLVRRRTLSSSGFVEAPVVPAPAPDIPAPPEADRPSIAVLPFVSSADDKDSQIFADGMTDDIITALSHVPGFFVTSSNSTFAYKGQSVDTRQIGRELGVRYVIEGRVQRSRNDVRVNTKLVEARTGDQIWSEQFSGDLSDIFALQDDVARSIVAQLHPELMQAEWRRGARNPSENLDAWTLLHSARMRYQVGFDRDSVDEAIRLAGVALEKDPGYAEAHGFLAEALGYRIITWSNDPESDTKRAADHSHKALELDPNNPTVLLGAGVLNAYTGHIDAAAAQIGRCCAINPNDAHAQALRAPVLAAAGRGEEGLEAGELALRLSPRDPRRYLMLNFIGWAHLHLGLHSEAEQKFRLSLDLYDGFFWSWLGYLVVLATQEKTEEAKAALTGANRLAPDYKLTDLEKYLRTVTGHSDGERSAIIDRQIDSLRDIWPE